MSIQIGEWLLADSVLIDVYPWNDDIQTDQHYWNY